MRWARFRKCSETSASASVSRSMRVALRLQIVESVLAGRVRGPVCHRGHRRVQGARSGLQALDVGQGAEADGAVAVQLDRPRSGGLHESRDQLVDRVGREQAPGVLEVEPVDVLGAGHRPGALEVVGMGVDRADRVGQSDNHLLDTLLPRHPREPHQRLRIIRRLGDLESPDPVAGDAPEDEPDHVLPGRGPRDEAHAGGDEVEGRLGHRLADEADPLPGVLVVEADRDRHVSAGGEVEGPESDPIHRRGDVEHVRGGQAGRAPEALVAVPGGRVNDLDELAAHRLLPAPNVPITRSIAERGGWA